MSMKIASDLKRMADPAVDIAEETVKDFQHGQYDKLIRLSLILTRGQMTRQMVHGGLNS